MVDQFYLEAEDELIYELNEVPSYEEVIDYLESKLTGVEDICLQNLKRKYNGK